MSEAGFKPKPEFVKAVVDGINSKMKDRDMAAMFIAQMAHESGGFQYIEEIACVATGCPGQYGSGAPGKSYHGRGFIQLSWPDNYKAASQALGMGDSLYTSPEKVAQDPKLGFDVSNWYWTSRVETAAGVKDKKLFGLTTKAINGKLECNGQNVEQSKKRYEIYKKVAAKMGIQNPAGEGGCY